MTSRNRIQPCKSDRSISSTQVLRSVPRNVLIQNDHPGHATVKRPSPESRCRVIFGQISVTLAIHEYEILSSISVGSYPTQLQLTMQKTQLPSILLRRRHRFLRSSGLECQLVPVQHFHVTPTSAADQTPPGIHTMTDRLLHPD